MRRIFNLVLAFVLMSACMATAADNKFVVESFEKVWSTLRDRYWDVTMAGLNWQAIHDQYLMKVRMAGSSDDARDQMSAMIHKLPSSHLALIPADVYSPSTDSSARPGGKTPTHGGGPQTTGIALVVIDRKLVVQSSQQADVHPGWIVDSIDGDKAERLMQLAGEANVEMVTQIADAWLSGAVGSSAHIVFIKGDGSQVALELARKAPTGKLVQFTNLPPERVIAEHKKLPGGAGYIRLNIFLDPVSVMPEFEQAITDLRSTPGIILDLRDNPGGLGLMAMGLAGWFVSDEGQILGTMQGRGSKTEFQINPRLEPYTGKLAILVNGGSASTSEILAQGLKDLGRARIFGTRTAGAALLSQVIELPDGDRFQYPEANYTSFKGRSLEGNGVEPDVVAAPTIAALLAGHDLALESAISWSIAK